MLLTIRQAKQRLNAKVGEAALKEAAFDHGHLVTIGARSFILESELEDLVKKCQPQRKVPGSCSGDGKGATPSTSSKTQGNENEAQARAISASLKQRSQRTSTSATAEQQSQSRRK